MKKLSLLLIAVLATLVPASAAFSEKRLEATKKSAAEKGKLIAFFVEQEYKTGRTEPKDVVDVDSNNNAMKKAVPRKYVELVMIDAGESRGVDKIPQCVQDAMKNKPQLIVTDAACTKVLATLDGRPDRKKAEAFEKKVAEAAATAAAAGKK